MAVDDLQDALRVEPVALRPASPVALDRRARVHERAVEVEEADRRGQRIER
jgi:hypothetical protein